MTFLGAVQIRIVLPIVLVTTNTTTSCGQFFVVCVSAAAGGAAAVCIAGVGAEGVLPAVVPAGALGHLLGGLAGVVLGVVHQANIAGNLVGLPEVEAGEKVPAVCGVVVEGVLVDLRAAEAPDNLGNLST